MKRTFVALACPVIAVGLSSATAFALHESPLADPEPPFVVCENQRYALCATAQCFVYNEIAYCKCDVLRGDSISLQLSFASPTGEKDVCEVNREGRFNGYMASTFSLPAEAVEGGRGAVYTCPGSSNAGGGVAAPVAYGQCDGAICFTSTIGRSFPGFPRRLRLDEIMCSCPISTTSTPGSSNPLGYQIFGPYHPTAPSGQRCEKSACELCTVASPSANGSTIPVGAPTGTADFLTLRLDGPPLPVLNRCQCTCAPAPDGTTSCTLAGDAGP